jgi:protein TonB
MKKILILILISLAQNVFSQIKTTDNLSSNPPQEVITEENNSVHNLAGLEIKPEFPGGIDNLQRFIKENYKTPKIVGLKGKVYMTFIIEKDGSLSDIRTTRDLKHGTGEEAIRVLKISPKWVPGKQKGELVRVLYSIAIPINQ